MKYFVMGVAANQTYLLYGHFSISGLIKIMDIDKKLRLIYKSPLYG